MDTTQSNYAMHTFCQLPLAFQKVGSLNGIYVSIILKILSDFHSIGVSELSKSVTRL